MEQPAAAKAVRVRIEGRVQGVWFRAWTSEQAQARGLRGWVRNCRDGSVEALFAGEAERVDEMVAACWQGPPLARVRKVTASAAEPPDGGGFHSTPTA